MKLQLVAAALAALLLNQLAVKDESGWRSLFDGRNLDAWKGYKTDKVPAGWRIAGGTLTKDGRVEDIVSKDEFGNFELEMDWRIGEAGNSGIFYRGTEEYDHIYWSGPEYQLLDDLKAEDNKTRFTCAGAVYAIFPSPAGHLHPVARIAQRGRAVSRRCFASDGMSLVMPAFGAFTGGLNVRDRAFTSVFGERSFTAHMLGDRKLYAFTASRCLSD